MTATTQGPTTHNAPRRSAAPGFGATLQHHRTAANLSQAKLARRAGITHGAISRLESGERHPRRENVDALATALGMDSSDRARLFIAAGMWPSNWPARMADELLGKGGAA